MKNKLKCYVPLGANLDTELKWIAYGLVAAFIYSLSYFITYSGHYRALFRWDGMTKVLQEGAVMPDFIDILGVSLIGFVVLAVCMIAMLVYHYASHFQGSKSIYLMRRLPSRWELWRRCLTLPVLVAVLSLVVALILLLIYFGHYMARTPDVCLTGHQWQKIWNVLLGALS